MTKGLCFNLVVTLFNKEYMRTKELFFRPFLLIFFINRHKTRKYIQNLIAKFVNNVYSNLKMFMVKYRYKRRD